jgi:6-phosphogluconate dehydrogenase
MLIQTSAGAGHYVKMVHNGIEYGDMQLISEVSNPLLILTQTPTDRNHRHTTS